MHYAPNARLLATFTLPSRTWAVLASCGTLAAVVLLAPASAHAQNALGTGNALDANRRVGSNGINERGRDVKDTIRLQNAIFDGTAGGGRSFRDASVGGSGSAFRDFLGGTQNFNLQREASFSGLSAGRSRTSDLLSNQSALYSGNVAAAGFAEALNPSRYGAATSGTTLASLRSSAQREWDKARQPSVLGEVRSDGYKASPVMYQPLRGLSFADRDRADVLPISPLERPMSGWKVPGEAEMEAAEARRASANGRIDLSLPASGAGFGSRNAASPGGSLTGTLTGPLTGRASGELRPGESASPFTSDRQLPARISTKYDEVESRYQQTRAAAAKKDGTAQGTEPPRTTGDDAMSSLRDVIRSREAGRPGSPTGRMGQSPTSNPQRTPSEPRPVATPAERNASPVPKVTIPVPSNAASAVETLRAMTGADPIRGLSERPRTEDDWYNIVMDRAQQLMTQGRYFEAEEAYTRLLAAKKGDAMARLGRVHAQLGAGAYMTAGKGLTELLRDKPQLIPVRIIERGIVPRAIAEGVAKDLQGELAKPVSPIRDESGVLLAYLGYQFGETRWLTEGLGAADKLVEPLNAPLYTLLADVWTKPSTETPGTPAAPGPSPAPAPQPAPGLPEMNK